MKPCFGRVIRVEVISVEVIRVEVIRVEVISVEVIRVEVISVEVIRVEVNWQCRNYLNISLVKMNSTKLLVQLVERDVLQIYLRLSSLRDVGATVYRLCYILEEKL